jgi:TolB protein
LSAAALVIAQRSRAAEPQQETFATGRIYAAVTWQPPGARRVTQIVAIDPETGVFDAVAASGNSVRVSPDGRTIAFRDSHEAGSDVLVRNVDEDTSGHQIWTGEGTADVCWTHDGAHVIVAQAIRADNRWKFTTWLVEPKNGEATQLKLPDTEGIVDCAHHDDLLISWSFRNKKSIDLFLLRPDGSEAKGMTGKGQYDYYGRFSPDDTKIAFARRQGGKLSVCTVDVDGKNPQIAFTEGDLAYPERLTWSPDGMRLAAVLFDWSRDEQGRKVFRDADANFRLAITSLDGSDFRELKLQGDVSFIGDIDWR